VNVVYFYTTLEMSIHTQFLENDFDELGTGMNTEENVHSFFYEHNVRSY